MQLNLEKIRQVAAQVMAGSQVPGMVLAVARGNQQPEVLVFGTDATGEALYPESLFAVASVTKLATSLAVLRLVDRGLLALDTPLVQVLPNVAARDGVTIRGLLCHTSGLPLDLANSDALYAPGLDWPQLRAACLTTAQEAPPDTRVQYSNVGYGLLAAVVEHLTSEPYGSALQSLVLEPLGVEGYLGVEPPRQPARVAKVRGPHAGGPHEPFNSPFWRSLALPWAGMLTTAAGALVLVQAFTGRPAGFLSPATLTEATSDQTHGLAGGFVAPMLWNPCPWGLGPEIRGAKTPHWTNPDVSSRSFGHSGASGTLAWADPVANLAWSILGARTADSGWLLRRGPTLCTAIIDS